MDVESFVSRKRCSDREQQAAEINFHESPVIARLNSSGAIIASEPVVEQFACGRFTTARRSVVHEALRGPYG